MRDYQGMPSVESLRPPCTAVLVVRVWAEESTEPPGVRIRVTGRSNVASPVEETHVLDTAAGAVTWIQDWLDRAEPIRSLN